MDIYGYDKETPDALRLIARDLEYFPDIFFGHYAIILSKQYLQDSDLISEFSMIKIGRLLEEHLRTTVPAIYALDAQTLLVLCQDSEHIESLDIMRLIFMSNDRLIPALNARTLKLPEQRHALLFYIDHAQHHRVIEYHQTLHHHENTLSVMDPLLPFPKTRATKHFDTTILLVDHEPQSRALFKRHFESQHLVIAKTIEDAIKKQMLFMPPIIFINLGMHEDLSLALIDQFNRIDPRVMISTFNGETLYKKRIHELQGDLDYALVAPFRFGDISQYMDYWKRYLHTHGLRGEEET